MIVDKPWGKVATYALNQPSSVRVITVEPEQETSVHFHRMRDEMGRARRGPHDRDRQPRRRSPAGGGVHDPRRGDSPHPLHRIVARAYPEIAYGYTMEDDTQRLEDAYGRPLEPDW